ncbi:hypothetical protein K437DRAFT_227106, partial [Tilletiaria anomala UBC 951]
KDLRNLTFAQALPTLTRLAQDETFLAALLQLKRDQDALEDELLAGRLKLTGERGEHLRGPGSALVQANAAAYDRKILKRWDELRSSQQKHLQELGVPCFFCSTHKADIARQERVMQLLGGLLE